MKKRNSSYDSQLHIPKKNRKKILKNEFNKRRSIPIKMDEQNPLTSHTEVDERVMKPWHQSVKGLEEKDDIDEVKSMKSDIELNKVESYVDVVKRPMTRNDEMENKEKELENKEKGLDNKINREISEKKKNQKEKEKKEQNDPE